ncbi:MAG: Hydroxyacylglutathione hydrolase [Chloroflexi bacterium ADurb.Bin360]|nr:MAG: Hydroxyacylglutathione hydrolase [Chloroflexi bacterium ADurb.Bin360]
MTAQSFQQLTPNLWVTQSPIFDTNSGIFMDAGQACLIDPGITEEEIRGIARFTLEQGASVQTIILTHGHWDHLLGPEHFPGVKVIAHTEYKRTLAQRSEAILQQISRWEAQAGILRSQPLRLPQPTLAFEGTLNVSLGRYTLRLIPAAGHAADQIALYEAEHGVLWAGDMLSDAEIPLVSHNLSAYQDTLARLSTLDVRALIPGHGTPTTDPVEIRARLNADQEYLKELSAQVHEAVLAGKSLAETVAACAGIAFRQPQENAGMHQLNVEGAFVELGGVSDTPLVGWMREEA